jgi:hypothetical protein
MNRILLATAGAATLFLVTTGAAKQALAASPFLAASEAELNRVRGGGPLDLFLNTKDEGWHGHCTSTAVLGLTPVYELTGDPRYLDTASLRDLLPERGPVLLGLDQERNAGLDWNRNSRG